MNEFLQRIEKLSPKRLALLAIELQSQLEQLQQERTDPIAVIGIGCRLPGSDGPEGFWDLLSNGRDAVREVPAERWAIDDYYDPNPDAPGRMSTRWGGFLDEVDQFDAPFFGISRREAASMDPQQRLLLEVCWEALEHAGQSPRKLSGTPTGVFAGLSTSDYHHLLLARGEGSIDAYVATGAAHSIAAGRLAYVLGLQGPNVAIDTACSSSLVAVHLACQSLRMGECRLALAGGANVILSPTVTIALSKAHMMAPDGRCKTFDAAADGFVRGEGCGVLVLKRLSAAVAEGDRVLALIRGSAVNQDGRSSGITAPNGAAQEAVIRQALANARVEPNQISYIEAHGTGTSLGDPIEAHALAAVFGPGREPENPLVVGSVKTNIGHLEAAAGVAGLIKVILALRKQYLPAHLHFERMNPHIDWKGLPVEIPVGGREWSANGQKRLAGVSSFGFSGTNAHIVLEEAPPVESRVPERERPAHVLALSARSDAALEQLTARYREHVVHSTDPLGDICFTANAGRAHFSHRAVFLAASVDELRDKLAGPALAHGVSERPPEIAFLFTGQGAQHPGMGRELFETQPVFRKALERCDEILRRWLEHPLLEVLYGNAAHLLDQTAYTQPAMFAFEYALAELWQSWGIRPSAVLGHSVGEYAAASIAGLCTLEQGLDLIAARAGRMQQLAGPGGMAAVLATEQQILPELARFASRVSIAALNAPQSLVLAGYRPELEQLTNRLRSEGIRVQPLTVSHGFHSPQMDPMLDEFGARGAAVDWQAPRVTLISSVTGQPVQAADFRDPEYWRRQVRQPVRFQAAMETLGAQGYSVFVEIGPGTTLLGLGRQTIGGQDRLWTAGANWRQMLESLAKLYARGAEVDWAAFDAPYGRRRVSLPAYPFERQRYWIEAPRPGRDGAHPMLETRVPSAVPIFEGRLHANAFPFLAEHRVGGTPVAPAAVYLELALAAAKQAFGLDTAEVRQLEIREPLRLAEDGCRVQIVFTAGAEPSFQIFSRPDRDGECRWTLHVEGKIAPAGTRPETKLPPIQAPEMPVDTFYAALRERGIDLGPACRGIEALWSGEGEAWAKIRLDGVPAQPGYRFHPALLDACFHAVGAAVASRDSSPARTQVLAGIAAFRLFRPAEERLVVHARADRGELQIFHASGELIAEAAGVQLKPIALEAPTDPEKAPDDWFYTLNWEPRPNSTVYGSFPPLGELAGTLEAEAVRLRRQEGYDRYDRLRPRLEELASVYIVEALRQMGCELRPGVRFSAAGLPVIERHRALLGRMLEILAEDGILRRAGDGWEALRAPESGQAAPLFAALSAEFPEFAAELSLTDRCASELAGVLRGQVNPMHLLFPGGSLEALAKLYMESPGARASNQLVRQAITAAIDRLPSGRRIRILEIGAGTGGTTAYLAPALPADRVEYVFSDVSPLFLERARAKFSPYLFFRYELLDIERDPGEQGFAGAQFDIVIAANVLHATADLGRTVGHARKLLAPGGLVVLLEGTYPERWVDLTFGMTEGWWKFEDRNLRPGYPLVSRQSWLDLLAGADLEETVGIQAEGSQQALLLARAGAQRQSAGRWLIVPDSSGVSARLGLDAEIAMPGRPIEAYLASGSWQGVLHLRSLDVSADALEISEQVCLDLLGWAQALARCGAKAPRLWIATQGAQPVETTSEPAVAQAPVWGFARSLALEHPEFWGGLVDLDPQASVESNAAALTEAVLAPDDEDQVAWRAGRRYVARLLRRKRPQAAGVTLRAGAAYLITGGLGALGLQVARWMAARGARKLVLAGRRGLAGCGEQQLRVIREIESLGAAVRVISADVADPAGLTRIAAAFAPGELRGVVHAAADLHGSLLTDMAGDDLRRVLRPKTRGAWALDEWTRLLDLDFFVLFSSTTSLIGSRRLAHYGGANQFLDCLAHCRRARGLPALSVNWGTWEDRSAASEEERREYIRGGLHPMPTNAALDALGDLLGFKEPQITVAHIDWSVLKPLYAARRSRPLFERLSSAAPRTRSEATPANASSDLAARLAAAPVSERAEMVAGMVRAQAAAVLGLKPAEVDSSAGLFEQGMDSLMSVELKARLETAIGQTLPSTLTFNYPSVRALSAFLLDRLAPALPAAEPQPEADDDLSEDELAALLAESLNTLQ